MEYEQPACICAKCRSSLGRIAPSRHSGNLTPRTILVKHDNSPILTGFERTKIPSETSVASSSLPTGQYLATVAPEVQAQGLAAADQRLHLFQGA